MPVIVIENASVGTIPVGTLVVVDTKKVRAYDSETDNIEDVVGTAYATSHTSGRGWIIPDGPEFYLNDTILWNEDLTYVTDENDNPVVNENYVGFNPYADTDHFTCVIYTGFTTVLKPYSAVPSRWILLHEGEDYDWYLVQ